MKKIILFSFLSLLLFSCKDEIYSTIPNAPVDIKLDLSFEDMKLTAPYEYVCFTTPRKASDKIGYGGVLVISGLGDRGIILYAYDLACPVEATKSVKVVPDNIGYCTCPECGTKYNIANGSGVPVSGPGKYFLRPYTVIDTGNNTYRVTNSRY